MVNLNDFKVKVHAAGIMGKRGFFLGSGVEGFVDRYRAKAVAKRTGRTTEDIHRLIEMINKGQVLDALGLEKKIDWNNVKALQKAYNVEWALFMELKGVLKDIEKATKMDPNRRGEFKETVRKVLALYHGRLSKINNFNQSVDREIRTGSSLILATSRTFTKQGGMWGRRKARILVKGAFKERHLIKSTLSRIEKEMKKGEGKQLHDDIKNFEEEAGIEILDVLMAIKRIDILLEDLMRDIWKKIGIEAASEGETMPPGEQKEETEIDRTLLRSAHDVVSNVSLMINQIDDLIGREAQLARAA